MSDNAFNADKTLQHVLLICLVAGVTISLLPGVSFVGHFGGFIAGALATMLMVRRQERVGKLPGRLETRWLQTISRRATALYCS